MNVKTFSSLHSLLFFQVDGLAAMAGGGGNNAELSKQVKKLENENKTLKKGKKFHDDVIHTIFLFSD